MKSKGDFTDSSRFKKQLKYEVSSNVKLQNGLLQTSQVRDTGVLVQTLGY